MPSDIDRSTRVRILVGALVVVFLIAGMATKQANQPAPKPPSTVGAVVAVPNVVNGYVEDMVRRLCARGLRPRIVKAPPMDQLDTGVNGYAVGEVTPAVGSKVPEQTTVDLTLVRSVNAGGVPADAPAVSVLPTVVGDDPNAAISALTWLGFLVNVRVQTPADGLAVLGQSPAAGMQLAQGQTVTLIVGSAPNSGCDTD